LAGIAGLARTAFGSCFSACCGIRAYLTDVLTKLVNNWPNSRLAELTPWTWAAEHP
jgi:hypothetical protein